MLFNSIEFAFFLPIVFILYWLVVKSRFKFHNVILLAASYIFYGWWDWRFLSLIVFSSFVDYFIGIWLYQTEDEKKRKLLLYASIIVNLGFLGFFKYFNFFATSFAEAFTLLGQPIRASRLDIILPVGISFYTFQTLSYSIDIYRKNLTPTKDIIAFFSFVSFFPQLVAGPIERASNLLPQFYSKRKFDYRNAIDGLRQMLWGLFKKIVIADNCAEFANTIFNNSGDYGGSTLLLGAIFFTFQIYGDFSGYSDIAIGTSRLFGFNLKQNFAFPYFSRDIAEFWRRWHISLTTWFRDYVYIPLGGSRGSNWLRIRNTFIIFIVSGFWHGANWTFIVWGALNAIYFLPLLLLNKNKNNVTVVAENSHFPTLVELFKIIRTFLLTVVTWVFFRADSLTHAFSYFKGMFSSSLFSFPENILGGTGLSTIILICLFLVVEWVGRRDKHALENFGLHWNRTLRYTLYYTIIFVIIWFGGREQAFIYFQF